jgi:transposase
MAATLFELPEEEKPIHEPEYRKIRLEKGNRYQAEMRTASLDELVPADHRVRIVWAMAEMKDFSLFYKEVESIEGEAGRPAIDPRILFSLWLYATLDNVGSARELSRLCQEHIAYQWLAGNLRVNYHTLADFRVKCEAELDDMLAKDVTALAKEGLVMFERTSQDGMRIRASAGAQSFRREGKLQELLSQAEALVKDLKDQNEDEHNQSDRQRSAQERAAKERVERIKRSLDEIEKIKEKREKSHKKAGEEREPRASTTDPEARFLRMASGETRPAYNAEISMDTNSRLIVAVDMINEVDQGQMDPMLDQIHEKYDRYPEEHLVDAGFVTVNDIEAAHKKGVSVYAPVIEDRRPVKDPEKKKGAKGPGIVAWKKRMEDPASQEKYKLRAATIEWVNALARNRGLRMLRVRGLHKVRAILLWFALAHNLMQTQNLRLAGAM